ncbi:MAG: cysteine hydrolase family protein [Planctomycetota bacterium]
MQAAETALILIGFQNDYFRNDGVLRSAIEDGRSVDEVLERTTALMTRLGDSPVTMIATPILFTPTYEELVEPTGILKVVRDSGAFREGTTGGQAVHEFASFGERLLEVPGKRGLNAFSNTDLDEVLKERGIRNVAIAGAITSICIDSTGRAAMDRGYRVTILSDCTVGRTAFEQDFYCREILPLYAAVCAADAWARQLEQTA